MTVTEAVTASGITPSADYKGIENTDDFVLAICTEASKKDAVKDWTVCADHVREHSGALNASTSDNTYIRTGPGTQYPKAGLARNGEKYVNANPDKWVPVLVDGEIRWISGKYAKAVETA